MSLAERRHRPLIFVDDLEFPILDPADEHHFARVRRIAPGDLITIADGSGAWCVARFGPTPEPVEPIRLEPRPVQEIAVGFAPVKGERPEWVVQKLTELGVDTIIPLRTDRSIVRWDEARAEKQLAKWRVIAREAAMQSRRVRLPVIAGLSGLPPRNEIGSVLADPDGRPLDAVRDHTVLIGPEGGWSTEERRDRELCALPGGILRAETAALVAAALLIAGRPD